jgi:hypothetical protein
MVIKEKIIIQRPSKNIFVSFVCFGKTIYHLATRVTRWVFEKNHPK